MATVHAPLNSLRAMVTPETPPSPTLTNPDMILPYSGIASNPAPLASSPTMRPPDLSASPDSAISISPSRRISQAELGVATAVRMPLRMRPGPPTNVLTTYNEYGHTYEHGAPLSDIGEEDTTPRSKRSRKSLSPPRGHATSPTPAGRSSKHKRRLSGESTSSIGSDLGNWEDFDSSRMMNGRLAADVAKAEEETDHEGQESNRNSAVTATADDEVAILNAKAEKILANARKRLTHMEDNLSKARHSILHTQRSSPSLGEVHQPVGGLYRSISLAGAIHRKSRPLYPFAKTTSGAHTRVSSDTTNSGLKRLSMIPEVRSASAQEYGRNPDSPQQSRSLPVVRNAGNSPASSRSVHSPMLILEEEEQHSSSATKASPDNNHLPRGLGINTLAAVSKEDISMTSSPSPTTLARSASAASSRSTRSIREQMSDLKSRIVDLKTKTQADGARRKREQSRNTPSPFASAQTPEQWYTGAPEYKEGGTPLNTNAGLGWSSTREINGPLDLQKTPSTPNAQMFLFVEPPSTAETAIHSEVRTDVNTPSLHKRTIDVVPHAPDDAESLIEESQYEDAAQEFEDYDDQVAASEEEQIYLNEVLEESLQDVEPQVPDIPEHLLVGDGVEAERHEDRLDAFDYENMFLHSAMGNYRGEARRRSPSEGSNSSSVETRRAAQQTPTVDDDDEDEEETDERDLDDDESQPTDEEAERIVQDPAYGDAALVTPRMKTAPYKPWTKTARSNSLDSVSTAATFATATEERYTDEAEMPKEILHWGNGAAFAPPPLRSPNQELTSAWPTPPTSARLPQTPIQPLHMHEVVKRHPSPLMTTNGFPNSGMPTPPSHSPVTLQDQQRVERPSRPASAVTTASDHPANTEILMESLIKLADPDFRVPEGRSVFADVDKELVLQLLRAVGGVCDGILKANSKGEQRWTSALRRRLEVSRMLLEGGDAEEEEEEEE